MKLKTKAKARAVCAIMAVAVFANVLAIPVSALSSTYAGIYKATSTSDYYVQLLTTDKVYARLPNYEDGSYGADVTISGPYMTEYAFLPANSPANYNNLKSTHSRYIKRTWRSGVVIDTVAVQQNFYFNAGYYKSKSPKEIHTPTTSSTGATGNYIMRKQ